MQGFRYFAPAAAGHYCTVKVKLLGSEQFVSLRFFVGSAVGMDGTGFDRFIQTAGESFCQFSGGSIAGGDSCAEFFLNGFQFADTGAIAEIGFLLVARRLTADLVCAIFNFPSFYVNKNFIQSMTDY